MAVQASSRGIQVFEKWNTQSPLPFRLHPQASSTCSSRDCRVVQKYPFTGRDDVNSIPGLFSWENRASHPRGEPPDGPPRPYLLFIGSGLIQAVFASSALLDP